MSDLTTAISGPMVQEYKSISSLKVSRVSIQPENKTTLTLSAGNTSDVYFSFPSRPASFLNGKNSYLTFTYKYSGTASAGRTVSIANGTSGNFIKNLETVAGATSLELIQGYDALSSVVDDFQGSARGQTLGNILEDKAAYDKTFEVIKEGVSRSIAANGAGYTESRRVCIPLISLAVGVLQDKCMPMGNDVGLRLRLTFNDPNVALVLSDGDGNPTLGYTLEDITFEAEYLDSDPGTYNAIVEESGGIMKVTGTGISNFQSSLPSASGATSNTILVPARYSSVRNYLTSFRCSQSVTSPTCNSPGARTRANTDSWVFRIHGRNYPNLPVVADSFNSSETMCETLKCFHALHDTQSNVCFNAENWVDNNYNSSDLLVQQKKTSSFLLGVDFEEAQFSASQLSGMDTNSSNTFISTTHSAGYPALSVDTFLFL